ncbi:hypothetical protein GYMLUDRAFT_84993 [Collybiopsis luxurians FD-317 M1]|uniref:Uncharacterized protein n=1 Tax=Collybiopsis luxurians FD-317 M1 TaxID=944289 RepID=A0A0D0CQU1_9AGAR|nr:hypothetical protein GYMLUDRAFT_84993 [Collybiopsis luxurians FD-317 M1]
MIRQEFHDTLVSIIRWIKSGAPPKCIPFFQSDSSLEDESEYPNPFVNNTTVSRQGRLIIIGQPGIGKTNFLVYIWTLRMHLNLPTVLCLGTYMNVWKEGERYMVPTWQAELLLAIAFLPDNTWILFDSNETIPEVPTTIYKSTFFVMQATSPRQGRLKWVRKTPAHVSYYFMQPWTAEELVCGLQLQGLGFREATPTQLVEFFQHFGGSARDAYSKAFDLRNHLEGIKETAADLDLNAITRSLKDKPTTDQHVPKFPYVPEHLKHEFVSVFPINDDNRNEFEFRPPSDFMLTTIMDGVAAKEAMSRADLFTKLLQIGDIPSQTLAGHFYDREYHSYFVSNCKFSCYRMFPLSDSGNLKTQTWRSFTEGEHPLTQAVSFEMRNCMMFHFNTNEPLKPTPTVYYVPNARNFLTIDSFLCITPTHVLAIQATVGDFHKFSTAALDWFAKLGVITMEYALLTPPTVKSASVPFPACIPSTLNSHVKNRPDTIIPRISSEPLPQDPETDTLPVKIIGIYHIHMTIDAQK